MMEKPKILLADSSTFRRILLDNGLRTRGFEVVTVVKNGEEIKNRLIKMLKRKEEK